MGSAVSGSTLQVQLARRSASSTVSGVAIEFSLVVPVRGRKVVTAPNRVMGSGGEEEGAGVDETGGPRVVGGHGLQELGLGVAVDAAAGDAGEAAEGGAERAAGVGGEAELLGLAVE